MAQFFKFKFLIMYIYTFKLNFDEGQCYKKILNFVFFQKVEKSHNKIVKFALK